MPSSRLAKERVEMRIEKIARSLRIITIENKMINDTKNHQYFRAVTLKYTPNKLISTTFKAVGF